MTSPTVGKLKKVSLREIRKQELSIYFQLLEQNIDVLNSDIDLNLVNADPNRISRQYDAVSGPPHSRQYLRECRLRRRSLQ